MPLADVVERKADTFISIICEDAAQQLVVANALVLGDIQYNRLRRTPAFACISGAGTALIASTARWYRRLMTNLARLTPGCLGAQ